jgi:predicted alpha/beta-hydrolase family hydrolase
MASDHAEILRNGPKTAEKALILAHGAGAGMRSPFMEAFAVGLAARDVTVFRFEFPYMREIGETGRRRPPNPLRVLEGTWRDIIAELAPMRPVIGGKSMGGRIASLVADDSRAAGLVCLGYPFHPPGKPEKTRTAHLAALRTPTLICQGTRDPFGTRDDVAAYELSPAIEFFWLEDGNHSLEPRRASGLTTRDNWDGAIRRIADFFHNL